MLSTGLQLVSDIARAEADGITKGSRIVRFTPGPICAGKYTADPGTAGSTTLLLQVSLPVLLFSSRSLGTGGDEPASSRSPTSRLILHGGTNALNAPLIDYTQHVFLPFLYRHFGISRDALNLDIKKRGYYPRGGGKLDVTVSALTEGQTIPAVNLTERGSIISIQGYSYVSGSLPPHLVEEIRSSAYAALEHLIPSETQNNESFIQIGTKLDVGQRNGSPGSGIMIWAQTASGCIIGGSALGRKNVLAKETGKLAADELLRNLEHGGCVDEYLQVRLPAHLHLTPMKISCFQDQIIVFMALAEGKSSVLIGPLTLHTR